MNLPSLDLKIKKAAEFIKKAKHITAFTGAGISVESGVPPFRGENGLWEKYNPKLFDIDFFEENPKSCWTMIKEIFLDSFEKIKPNSAHKTFSKLEKMGNLKAIITQNIDNLHQKAGSKNVIEFHGNSQYFVCLSCGAKYTSDTLPLQNLPPRCEKCGGLIKPDFVFFGEGIPQKAYSKSIEEAKAADLFILVGSTGVVMPAANIPYLAANNGCKIIEINPNPSAYTNEIVDLYIPSKAVSAFDSIAQALELEI